MCMEDIRIGRDSVGAAYTKPVTTGSRTLILPANPDRIAFSVGTDAAQTVYITPQACDDITCGWCGTTNDPNIYFDMATFGKLIQGEWYARARTAAGSVQVVEVLLQRK